MNIEINKRLTKKEIYEIFSSCMSNEILSIEYNRSPKDIEKIRTGKLYKHYTKDYKPISDESKSILDKIKEFNEQNNPISKNTNKTYYYYYYELNVKELRVSFGNFLFTINLKTKEIKFDFNKYIKGDSITYARFEQLIIEYNIIL